MINTKDDEITRCDNEKQDLNRTWLDSDRTPYRTRGYSLRSVLRRLLLPTLVWTIFFIDKSDASHPISLTRASIYLTREAAEVRIEVFLEDLYLFHQLQPNREDFLNLSVIRQGIQLHEQFLSERFEITDVQGNRFESQSVSVAPYDLPAEGVPLSDLMGHQLVFDLQYNFDQPPEFLTFTQMFTDEEAILPSETKLEIKQQGGGALVEHTLLPHEPYSMRVNWENPPLSPEASEEERSAWQKRAKESLLGITNYSRVYSFLYIDDFEVRHEFLIPYLSLDEDLVLARDEDSLLDLTEQDLARQQIEGYFASGNPLTIDGRLQKPIVQRCDFYGLDMTDFAIPSKRRVVPVANARVALILTYRLDATPSSLELTWNRFNNAIWSVSTSIIGQGEPIRKDLSRIGEGNTLKWTRPSDWRLPDTIRPVKAVRTQSAPEPLSITLLLLGLIAVGISAPAAAAGRLRLATTAGILSLCSILLGLQIGNPLSAAPNLPLDDEEAGAVFEKLHDNIYAAFQRRTEESIYDGLESSVDGDLLRRIYLEISQGLTDEENGAANAKIESIQRLKVTRNSVPPPESVFAEEDLFGIDCSWRVVGRVEHWGHVHIRDVLYQAQFHVADMGPNWKLIAMEAFSQSSMNTQTQLAQ